MNELVWLLVTNGFILEMDELEYKKYSHPTISYTVDIHSDGVWLDSLGGAGKDRDSLQIRLNSLV